jgi:hypothetical protein
MSKSAEPTICQQLTLFAEGSHVKTCPLPDAARVWLESEAGFGPSTIEFLQSLSRDGWLSKTSPVCYRPADVPLVEPCVEYCESIGISEIDAKSISRALSAFPENEC